MLRGTVGACAYYGDEKAQGTDIVETNKSFISGIPTNMGTINPQREPRRFVS